MSLTGVIGVFATGTYVVTRTAAGTLSSGVYTSGATSTVNITASVQPLNGRDRQVLPEGIGQTDARKVITTTQLYAGGTTYEADKITIDGETWVVVHVDGPWIAFGGTHYNVTVTRESPR